MLRVSRVKEMLSEAVISFQRAPGPTAADTKSAVDFAKENKKDDNLSKTWSSIDVRSLCEELTNAGKKE